MNEKTDVFFVCCNIRSIRLCVTPVDRYKVQFEEQQLRKKFYSIIYRTS